MHGDQPEVLDGTQLAADWTFSGLQKFGQGLMDRLRGQKLPNKLLERVSCCLHNVIFENVYDTFYFWVSVVFVPIKLELH